MARKVKKDIQKINFSSIARLKLNNYIYRKKGLYEYLKAKVDVSKYTRMYSVEVANLGAWDTPASDIDVVHFTGMVNADYDGCRALFTLGTITVGGNMSITVTYDTRAVNETDASVFARIFELTLQRLVESPEKVSVGQVRSDQEAV